MSTATTLATAIDQANPNRIADALRLLKLGQMLTPRTSKIMGAAAVKIALDPPALAITSVRVVNPGAGTAVSGGYIVQDAGGAAVDDGGAPNKPGTCLLADDGSTLEFATALALVDYAEVCYIPRSDTDITAAFEIQG